MRNHSLIKECIMEERHLHLLADKYKNINEVTAEMMNLGTILALPKGTEFFFSDLHGEHLAFIHLLKSASGVIKNKIDLLFADQMNEKQRQELAHLIYYPEELLEKMTIDASWYEQTIYQLITIAKFCSSKYTRSKVNKKLPKQYSYVITELLSCHDDQYIKEYYHEIIQNIMSIDNEKSLLWLCVSLLEMSVLIIFILLVIFLIVDHVRI